MGGEVLDESFGPRERGDVRCACAGRDLHAVRRWSVARALRAGDSTDHRHWPPLRLAAELQRGVCYCDVPVGALYQVGVRVRALTIFDPTMLCIC